MLRNAALLFVFTCFVTLASLSDAANFHTYAGVAHGEGSPRVDHQFDGPHGSHSDATMSYEGATGSADAQALAGQLEVNVDSQSSQGGIGTLSAGATASQSDSFIATLDGVPLSAGIVEITVQLSGFINESGNGANADGNWSLILGESIVQLHYEATGAHLSQTTLSESLSSPDGVPFEFTVDTSCYTLGLNDGSATGHFESQIIKMAYYEPNGVPNPNVKIKFGSASLEGDYNGDGRVDAADYVVWRANLGKANEMRILNNGDGGNIGPSDYSWWRARFGNARPDASASGITQNAVPEPANLLLLGAAALPMIGRRFGWVRRAAGHRPNLFATQPLFSAAARDGKCSGI